MSVNQFPNALPAMHRAAKLNDAGPDGERRSGADPGRFELAMTSTEPVLQKYGDKLVNETLQHGESNVRTARLGSGMVPLLFNHDPEKHIGQVDSYRIADGKLHVSGPFGPSALAQEKRADYDAGILKAASSGYRIHGGTRSKNKDNPNGPIDVSVSDWEPFEASLLTIPADYTVGAQRGADGVEEYPVEIAAQQEAAPIAEGIGVVIEVQPEQEKRNMADTVEKTAAELELARRDAIMAVAGDKEWGKHVTSDEVRTALSDKAVTADAFKDKVCLRILDNNAASKVGTLGDNTFLQASRKDQSRYSLMTALRSHVNERKAGAIPGNHEATFEREVSRQIEKTLGIHTRGIFIPAIAFSRALGTQAVASGAGQLGLTSEAAAVETITHPEVIELLRHRPRVQQLGARTLGGLQGIVRLPRQSGAGTWQWLGEGAAVTPSDLTMDFISVQPRRGSTQSAVDIELLASTSPDVEGLMRADFNRIRALGLDEAALAGPIGGPGPVGLLNATGLATIAPTGTTSIYTTAKMLCWPDVTNFEEVPAAADADVATSGWMVTPGIRQALKSTPMFAAGYAQPIWMPGKRDPNGLEEGPMGYMAGVTNQLPQNGATAGYTGPGLHTGIFGDWSQLILADWGVVEVIYDPYTQAGNGADVLTMRSLHDVGIRHIAAFVAATKIATA